MKAFNPVFGKDKINDKYKLYYLYNYDQNIRDLIYRYKGCNDYELKDAFIKRFSFWLRMKFSGYTIVPAPSSKEKEEERGFQHVEEVFSALKFKINQCFIKTSDFKQSSLTVNERKEVASKLEIVNGQSVKGKRILIVDDIYTTGSTVKAMISKLEPYHPKDIKVLVVAKTIYNPNKAHNNNLE
ncbi:MAG: hypothetical protein LUB56_00330 [Coprobacillus sp.]|nr:hypothetical protein [Coprobacillus sp.]